MPILPDRRCQVLRDDFVVIATKSCHPQDAAADACLVQRYPSSVEVTPNHLDLAPSFCKAVAHSISRAGGRPLSPRRKPSMLVRQGAERSGSSLLESEGILPPRWDDQSSKAGPQALAGQTSARSLDRVPVRQLRGCCVAVFSTEESEQ